jgi:hypothetical protein
MIFLAFDGKAGSCQKHRSFKAGKPGVRPGLSNRSRKEDQLMILVLVELLLAFAGRFTVIVLARKSRR